MNHATGERELFTLDGLGAMLYGTFHPPSNLQGGAGKSSSTGILFLAGLSMPRAAHGDSAVYWAESFAALGYPSFRVDLPGQGDSDGEVPTDLLHFISAGGYERVTAAVMKQLRERYKLTGLVLVGHCSGTITALFAAASSKNCVGLILLDPTFDLPPAARSRIRRAIAYWATVNRFGGFLSDLKDRLKSVQLRLHRDVHPSNANIPLLTCWKKVASSGLPILLLKAPELKSSGGQPRLGEFDYLGYIIDLAGSNSKVDVKIIEGARHRFSDGPGRVGVRREVADYLTTFFPPDDREDAVSQPMRCAPERSLAACESTFAGISGISES